MFEPRERATQVEIDIPEKVPKEANCFKRKD
jgi:hypothetical protein